MARNKKLTPVVIPQIGSWVDQGLSAHAIAEKIGCTIGTLRVRCSQLGISLRRNRNAEKVRVAVVAESSLSSKHRRGAYTDALLQEIGTTPCSGTATDVLRFNDRITPRNRLRFDKRRREASARELVSEQETHLVVFVSPGTVRQLRTQAALKGMSGSTLAAILLEKIAQDDLYDAVLDET